MITKQTLIQSLGQFKSDLAQLFATKAQAGAMEERLTKLETYATDQDILDLFHNGSSAGSGASYESSCENIALSATYASANENITLDVASYDPTAEMIIL